MFTLTTRGNHVIRYSIRTVQQPQGVTKCKRAVNIVKTLEFRFKRNTHTTQHTQIQALSPSHTLSLSFTFFLSLSLSLSLFLPCFLFLRGPLTKVQTYSSRREKEAVVSAVLPKSWSARGVQVNKLSHPVFSNVAWTAAVLLIVVVLATL